MLNFKRNITATFAAVTAFTMFGMISSAAAQECMIGEVKMFAGNFAPRSWALADGQLLPISQNTALFSILGTTYGGDGRTTFGLPDLRGRTPVGVGYGPGLTDRRLGSKFGSETNAQTVEQKVNHIHTAKVPSDETSEAAVTANNNQPINNMQPSLGMNFIICLYGIYPSRN